MIFIGEKPSYTAKKYGWKWEDRKLAGKQLFDCLEMVGIDPTKHKYINLWTYNGIPIPLLINNNDVIVGMGQKVQDELNRRNIEHIPIIHPAARGIIRRKENYAKMLKERLT